MSPTSWRHLHMCVSTCVCELSTRHRTVNLMVILNEAMKTAKRMRHCRRRGLRLRFHLSRRRLVSVFCALLFFFLVLAKTKALMDSYKLNGVLCRISTQTISHLKCMQTWRIYEAEHPTLPLGCSWLGWLAISALSGRHFRHILSATSDRDGSTDDMKYTRQRHGSSHNYKSNADKWATVLDSYNLEKLYSSFLINW